MIRYRTIGVMHLVAEDDGPIVLHADALAKIAKRDEQIADLKALLLRTSEALNGIELDLIQGEKRDLLNEEIEKALA